MAARSASLKYALRFAAITAALFAVYCFPYAAFGVSERIFEGYLAAHARAAGAIVGWFDPSARVNGTEIVGQFAVRIAKNCDAIEVNILFTAAVLAFPAPWAKRLVAWLVGLVLLVFANLLRICALYFVGLYAPTAFERAHVELFPLVLIVIATLEFVFWTNWMTRRTSSIPREGQ
jgi:exosortase/archaeosortase family protein